MLKKIIKFRNVDYMSAIVFIIVYFTILHIASYSSNTTEMYDRHEIKFITNTFNLKCNNLLSDEPDNILVQNAIKWEPQKIVKMRKIYSCESYLYSWKSVIYDVPERSEETDFPLAFSILTFKNFEQFEMLFKSIFRPWNYYCIYVDLNSTTQFFQLVNTVTKCLGARFDNTINIKRRINIKWNDISLLTAELSCMEELFWRYKSWKYFINLTGQEFPLKTNWELVRIFRTYKGANNVHDKFVKEIKGLDVNLTYPLTWHKGSVHITVNRHFVKVAISDKRVKELLEVLKFYPTPDEIFFASLNNNPEIFKLPGSYVGDKYIIGIKALPEINYISRFTNSTGHPCIKSNIVDTNCLWGVLDLPNLVKAPHLFANRVDLDFQPVTLKCLEHHYLKKLEREVTTNTFSINEKFYKARHFVQNKYFAN